MTALQLTNVCKSFGPVEVLKDINLTVEDGEFVVFVGPSGCGKSTLLRVISGLEDATAGEISIGGQTVTTTPPAKRGIAMVFQSYALYPHLTVRENMALALKQERQPKEEITARVAEASRMLSLEDYLDRRPSELSGGQRQRVAIGRAVVREPKLFLFDEPLSNLDAALRMNTRLEIARLHRQLSASMIYVTHDQIEAMTLADKIVVLRDGRIEQVGTPMELYNNPANRFVAEFIGAPAMNFVPAQRLGGNPGQFIGIRPEYARISPDGPLTGEVIHVEKLGGDTNILVDMGQDLTFTARLFGQHDTNVGETLQFDFDPANCLSFDEAGQRI
ncbi:ABC transporter ATP-binding protein [Phaeobacter sp. HS012]|uniref:ABC transporter ATP-binding protein n=1 Tax=Phaeobacter TaxID=302485 RepID=UPI000C9ADC06|nr:MULTISPECIES: ABC transporter ATP-binding protein [Phaeobacter]AUQ59560.1 ATP-binding transport protein SmoK [Phaeobacter inhibens]AUR04794.1 ATP-binding transport protein SmoK [Phaeobacter inhibens]AUR08842.1 ATP-binding transport protein SmoK [Phaeobacter inhibens]AUR12676.1 ATP-binding transport protein SmoK [Phaeobacter inhibens]MBQ4809079.1 ABC transporter ATP-binding protein [Phaeobacter sp. HS012]